TAAAYLVAQQAAGHGAEYGAGDLVLILDRLLTGHGDVLADFPGRLDGFVDRCDGQHLCVAWAAHQTVGGECAAGGDYDRSQYRSNQHGLIHSKPPELT